MNRLDLSNINTLEIYKSIQKGTFGLLLDFDDHLDVGNGENWIVNPKWTLACL